MRNKIILVSCFIFLFAGVTFADGRMVVKPRIDTGMSYDTNYFLDDKNERPVTKYYIKPGIKFGYTTAKSKLLFDYALSANWYEEKGTPPEGKVSADEYDYIGHDMHFDADTQITDRLNFRLEDTYILTRDPNSLDYYSNEIIKHKYSKNIFNPKLFFQFGEKFGIGAEYTNTNVDYKSGTDEDSRENCGTFNLHYNLNSLNSLDLGYKGWRKNYDSLSPDYMSNQVMLTFIRELKHYTITVGGGYQKRSFYNSDIKDINDFVWDLQLSGTRPKVIVALSQNVNDTAFNSDYYLATRFYTEYAHLFLEKLNVKLKGHYQYSDYLHNVDDRKDNSWLAACSVDYLRNEIFSIGLETGYETRDSSVSVNDYDNVFVLLEISLNFNVGSKNKHDKSDENL